MCYPNVRCETIRAEEGWMNVARGKLGRDPAPRYIFNYIVYGLSSHVELLSKRPASFISRRVETPDLANLPRSQFCASVLCAVEAYDFDSLKSSFHVFHYSLRARVFIDSN
jgi:hypothetical protein